MIKIDLLKSIPILVYTSNSAITTSRIGDIIVPGSDGGFEPRGPWESFSVANDWSYSFGAYNRPKWLGEDYLELFIADYDIEKIQSVSGTKESLELALLQKNENNGFQAAVCSGVTLSGFKLASDSDEAKVVFEISSCEMIYNR